MNVRVISPVKNLIDEAASVLIAENRDFSKNLVVFPGRRPAHFLRKAIAGQVRESFLPPVIYSMDSFIDAAYEVMAAGRRLDAIDAVAVLHEIHREASDRLGGDHFLSLDSFFPIGIQVFHDLEELLIEEVPSVMVKEIDGIATGSIPVRSLSRLQSLSFFYDRFYARIEEQGFSTRSLRYRLVADRIDDAWLDRFDRIVFAGFFALTKSEKRIFRKLADRGPTEFIFLQGKGLAGMLQDLGAASSAEPGDGAAGGPEIRFYSSPDTHGQIMALNAVIGKAGRDLDERVAIILPSSDALFPLLRQGLIALDDDAYNISIGYPLQRTPIFGFLSNLMDLVGSMDRDRVYLPSYLNFVLHPYTKNIYYRGNAEVTRILFHTIEEAFSGAGGRMFLTLEEIEDHDGVFERLHDRLSGAGLGDVGREIRRHLRMIHDRTVRRFLAFSNVRDFVDTCADLLSFIYHDSSARQHPFFHRFSEAFLQSLDDIAKSLVAGRSFADRDSYFLLFRKCIAAGSVPFEGTPVRGLQVLGMLETRSLKFDKVFVLSANEDVLPATKKDDTLIPFKARQLLGLPTYLDRDRLAAYNFDALLQGAKEVHLFFIESDTKERSRFVERLLWQVQEQEGKTGEKDYIMPVQYRVSLGNTDPGEIAKTEDITSFLKDFRYSPTSLDRYFRCGLQFYYQHVLRIGRREEVTGEIARADIGKSVHDILKAFFELRKGRRLTEADMDPAELEVHCRAHFRSKYGRELVGPYYLLERQVISHLKALLTGYYRPLVAEKEVVVTALEYEDEVSIDGCRLAGRMDCVETRDGKIHIIDFKTGASSAHLRTRLDKLEPSDPATWHEAIRSLQLPCYLMIYAGSKGISHASLNAAYLLLGRSVINREIELKLFQEGEAAAGYDALSSVIRSLLREITDSRAPFRSAADMKESCPSCDFRYICGTQWIVSRR